MRLHEPNTALQVLGVGGRDLQVVHHPRLVIYLEQIERGVTGRDRLYLRVYRVRVVAESGQAIRNLLERGRSSDCPAWADLRRPRR